MKRHWATAGAVLLAGGLVMAVAAPASASTTTAVTINLPTTLVPSPATLGSIVFTAPDEGGPDLQPVNVFVTITPNPAGQNGSPAGTGTIGIALDGSAPLQNCDSTYSTPFCEWDPTAAPGVTATLGVVLTPSSDAAGDFTLTVGVDNGATQRTTFTQLLSIGQPAGSFAASLTTTADTQQRPDAAVLQYSCDNGYAGEVTVPPGQTTSSTGALLVPGDTRCITTVLTDGVTSSPAPTVTATVQINGGTPSPLGDGVAVQSGDTYQVSYVYTFADLGAAAPGGTAPGTGTTAAADAPSTPQLAATGIDPGTTTAVLIPGVLFLVVGVLLQAWARRRETTGR